MHFVVVVDRQWHWQGPQPQEQRSLALGHEQQRWLSPVGTVWAADADPAEIFRPARDHEQRQCPRRSPVAPLHLGRVVPAPVARPLRLWVREEHPRTRTPLCQPVPATAILWFSSSNDGIPKSGELALEAIDDGLVCRRRRRRQQQQQQPGGPGEPFQASSVSPAIVAAAGAALCTVTVTVTDTDTTAIAETTRVQAEPAAR